MKNPNSLEKILIRGWYRNVQQLTTKEYSNSPRAGEVIDMLIKSGMDNMVDKSTATRWCRGNTMPSLKIRRDIDICTKSCVSDWLDNNLNNLPINPQIRIIKYAEIWINSSVKPHEIMEVLIRIKNKWQPEILTPDIIKLRKKIECHFSMPEWDGENSSSVVIIPNQVQFRLINQIDPTSITPFLLSLFELDWLLQKFHESQPFFYNYAFADLCVDLLGTCLLTDRLHLALGFHTYKQGSAGVGVSKMLMLMLLTDRHTTATLTPKALRHDLGQAGYHAIKIDHLFKNIFTMKSLLDKMLHECGTNWSDITNIQLPVFYASVSAGQQHDKKLE